jgi:outer membrane biosynthesis protein TonB
MMRPRSLSHAALWACLLLSPWEATASSRNPGSKKAASKAKGSGKPTSRPTRKPPPKSALSGIRVAGPLVVASLKLRSVKGALTRRKVSSIMDGVKPALRACSRRGTPSGSASFAIKVKPRGRPVVKRLRSSINDPAAERCARRALARARFPESDTRTDVKVTVRFLRLVVKNNLGMLAGGAPIGAKLGYGVGRSGRPPATSEARLGAPKVGSPSLPVEVIRRVVLQHKSSIHHCYKQTRRVGQTPKCKVYVQFFIDAKGNVSKNSIRSSTCNNSALERCINRKVKKWVFPQPFGGGTVLVTYPFQFSKRQR